MSGRCQNPGCLRLATTEVRIYGLGDRHLCYLCEQALTSMGMAMRPVAFIPEWRRRALRAKDMTGGAA